MKYEMFTKRKVFFIWWAAAYCLHPRTLHDLRNLAQLGHAKLYPRFCGTLYTKYHIFESFEDNAAREWQLALTGQLAQSRNLVLIWLENPVQCSLSACRMNDGYY